MANILTKNQYRLPLIKLAIPIVVQNLLSSAIGSMDVVMLNFVGQDAIAAVSLATQFTNILFMFFYGLGTGATMLAAQYYGKGDYDTIKTVEGIALKISMAVAVIFAISALVMPNKLMLIFTNDPVLIEYGSEYLRYVSIAYLCWSMIEIYIAVLRSIGHVTVTMVLNIVAFVMNIIFNAIFIFGLCGAPKLGAAGAAIGTSLARIVELLGCIYISIRQKEIKLDLRYMFRKNTILFSDFVNMALPALLNDIVWGLAFSVYSVILGHMGSDAVAANSMTTVMRNFGTVLCFGMASAGGIYLGQILGEGRTEESKIAAKELVRLTIVSAVIGSVIILASIPFIMRYASVSDTARHYIKYMLLINAYYVFGPAINTTMICGIFRAGGDSKYGFKVDIIDMWCYAVPLSLLCAFVFKLPVLWVYFFMCTDEFVKWPWVIGHYLKGEWAQNITRNF